MLTNMATHEYQAADKIRSYRQEAADYCAVRTSINPAPPVAHPRGTWLQRFCQLADEAASAGPVARLI